MRKHSLAAIAAIALLLSACGGGGGGSEPAQPVNTTIAVTGRVTASNDMYFGQQAVQAKREKAAALAASGAASSPGGDVDGDGETDYEVIDATAVAVIGAEVKATHKPTGEIFTATSGPDGRFNMQLKAGPYDIETRAHGADGKNIWAFNRGKNVTTSGDLGAFGLHRHPLAAEVWIDGVRVTDAEGLMTGSFFATPQRQVATGDVVEVRVVVADPNERQLTMRAFGHLGAGHTELPVTDFTMTYTVQASDLSLTTLHLFAEVNNDDGMTGMDAFRDVFIDVRYPVAGAPTAPELQGFRINGALHENTVPTGGMALTAAPVQPGAPITIETLYNPAAPGAPAVTVQWRDLTSTGLGGISKEATGSPVTIPGTATEGVYSVRATVMLYLTTFNAGHMSTITVPVDTTDKPAQLSGLLINGADPDGKVFRVGDTLSIQAQATDPNSRAMEYRIDVIGSSTTSTGWQPLDTAVYTLTQADVNASFRIRVSVRNDDGRVLDGYSDADGVLVRTVTVSE